MNRVKGQLLLLACSFLKDNPWPVLGSAVLCPHCWWCLTGCWVRDRSLRTEPEHCLVRCWLETSTGDESNCQKALWHFP